jgi:hypothetical protein
VAGVLSQESAGPEGEIDPPGLEPPALDTSALVLVPFCFWLPHPAGPTAPPNPEGPAASVTPQSNRLDPPDPVALRAAIAAHLGDLGCPSAEPLRWAITAVDPLRGLQLEGVGVSQAHQAQES